MDDDLEKLAEWVAPLLEKLSNNERRKLMQNVARDLRRRNQQRIRRNINPDGQPFEPRLRRKSGQVKRAAMFRKLPFVRFLRLDTTPESAAIGWLGRTGRIAGIHHYGLRAPVRPGGRDYQYPERRLLGFSREDHSAITDLIINHLADQL